MTTEALYDRIGVGYAQYRRTDARWAAAIEQALGSARTVINVGAGTGSYEPEGRAVLAVEPSATMIGQRPAGSAPAIRAFAEDLPVPDDWADAAMAVLAVHHWTDWRRGLAELRRVASLQVVLAADTRQHADFWFARDYVPELAEFELTRLSAPQIAAELGAHTVVPLPLAADFSDGVYPAYWRRPEAYLDPQIWCSASALAQVDPAALARGVRRLRADLESGRWHENYRELLSLDEYDAGFCLLVAGSLP
jgi:SAM-dependent methyltransferase